MSTLATNYRTSSQVDRKGFHDGRQGHHRFFDIGFDSRYDAAYRDGVRVRLFERPASFVDCGTELKAGRGDIE